MNVCVFPWLWRCITQCLPVQWLCGLVGWANYSRRLESSQLCTQTGTHTHTHTIIKQALKGVWLQFFLSQARKAPFSCPAVSCPLSISPLSCSLLSSSHLPLSCSLLPSLLSFLSPQYLLPPLLLFTSLLHSSPPSSSLTSLCASALLLHATGFHLKHLSCSSARRVGGASTSLTHTAGQEEGSAAVTSHPAPS